MKVPDISVVPQHRDRRTALCHCPAKRSTLGSPLLLERDYLAGGLAVESLPGGAR